MWPESGESSKPLRTGLTTGTCATACSVAAFEFLLTRKSPDRVSVILPKGKLVTLQIATCDEISTGVRASTIKDAGDDPDVTHGASIFVELGLTETPGVRFRAGSGVGTVTRDGLALAVGEPAINEVPRQMIRDHLASVAKRGNYSGGFEVSIGVVDGEHLAQKTMNPRLGILGGLSILGTTGIVRPYSCAAWIASIRQGIDVAAANGVQHIAASTGNSSEHAIKSHYQLEDMALIEMGDFAGAVLKHLRRVPIPRLSICGGFGKLTKLANGHMDLNSRSSSIDFTEMSRLAAELGAESALTERINTSNTSIEVLNHCNASGLDIASVVCRKARQAAMDVVPDKVEVEIWAINRRGEFVGHADFLS